MIGRWLIFEVDDDFVDRGVIEYSILYELFETGKVVLADVTVAILLTQVDGLHEVWIAVVSCSVNLSLLLDVRFENHFDLYLNK